MAEFAGLHLRIFGVTNVEEPVLTIVPAEWGEPLFRLENGITLSLLVVPEIINSGLTG